MAKDGLRRVDLPVDALDIPAKYEINKIPILMVPSRLR